MAINFPSSPSNNQLFVAEGKAMRYNASKGKWRQVSTLTSSQITDLEARTVGVSSMSISGNTLVIQKDDSSYANVSLASFAGNKLTSYANASILPLSDLVSGTQVYVEDTDSLYITDGSGWYKIATVNLSPSLTLGVESISLAAGGSIDVNYTVNEPEDTPYTISASSSSNATITVYQANNTITFNSPVQNTTETITITATDGVNSVGDTLTMTIALSYDWSTATQQALIQGSDISTGSYYGWDVDISDDGNYGIVGIYHGAVYIHTRSGSTWSQQQKITLTGENGARLGQAVAIDADGDTVVFGDWMGESAGGGSQGAAFVWTRSGSTWTQQAKLVSSDIQGDDQFGVSVDISDDGNTVVIGAGGEDTGGSNAGATYVFTRSGSTWSQQQKLTASDAAASDGFGGNVSISGDGNTIVVGAAGESTNVGAAYVFTVSGSTWSQHSKLTPSDTSNSLYFGAATHIDKDGDTIIVGAYFNNNPSTQIGAAYIFTLSGGTWSQQARLQHSEASSGFRDRFGNDVNLTDDGNTALIGAHQDNSDDGTCWIFTRSGSTWSEDKKLQPSVTVTDGQFGFSCSISGDGSTALIGSQQDAIGGIGRAYIFIGS